MAGNAAFKAGQYSEALRCYELGLDAQRHNMALHANAAMAALKLHCNVQALEHSSKVRVGCRASGLCVAATRTWPGRAGPGDAARKQRPDSCTPNGPALASWAAS